MGFLLQDQTVNDGFLTKRGESEEWVSNCKRED